MRLIDVDALKICYTGKNSLGTNNNDSKADYASIRKMIDSQPTAYDVGAVARDIQANGDGYIDGGEEFILIEKAIEIVKGGGVDE